MNTSGRTIAIVRPGFVSLTLGTFAGTVGQYFMAMHDFERPFFHEGFRLMARCPLCQTRYQPSAAKVIAEREDAYLLHVPCVKCKSAVVALIFANMFGVNSIGVLTDLTSDEVLSTDQQVVSADDVLEIYEAIADGSLASLVT